MTVMFIDDHGNWSRKAHFDCRSWVYPVRLTDVGRLFFSITSYLPKQTPEALQKLRQEELVCLRGNGRGERKEWERIYDYAYYNDLGYPSKGLAHERPVLGGSKSYPYPRRLRTGRPLSDKDHQTEERHKIINLDFYVPPDERFSPTKLSEFISSSIQAVIHFVLPELTSLLKGSDINNFESFDQISKDLYTRRNIQSRRANVERIVLEKLKEFLPEDIFKEVIKIAKHTPTIKFPIPQVIEVDQFAWKTDEEFAREMLAGLNPMVIKRLESFPPVGKDGRQSSILPTHIQNNLDGLTINQAIDQKRIFILDHHDYLMPYLRRINMQGECMYASRTLLLRRDNGTLKPLVIELSLPEEEGISLNNSRVFLPAANGIDGALWQLAKTHVSINDSGYHQLISHWLHTHAVVEPFIIATRRQLSTMHPIHKLLDPHFKDTMHINSLARSILLNAGGILEKTMFPAKFSMELSSTIYEDWRFEEQELPFDLLKSPNFCERSAKVIMNPTEIKKKRGKGRRKIEIKLIEEENKRQVCFSKRRQGLFKKASELSTLCGVEVAVVVFSPAGKPYFFGKPSVDHVLSHFLNVAPNPSDSSLPATTSFSEPQINKDQTVGESFSWDIDLHSMGVDELREIQEILAEQQSVVTEAAQQSYFQAPEAAMERQIETMEQIEALPHTYPEFGDQDDYFLCWEQADYDCLDIVPI